MRISVRPAVESDVAELDRIFRYAFATYLRLPELPVGDTDTLRSRWLSDTEGLLAAEVEGRLAGSNFLTRWGSFGFFGPLTVLPEYWDRGVGTALLEATVARYDAWGVGRTGLYTFPDSTRHVGLYQKFGYWPGRLTMLLTKAVRSGQRPARYTLYGTEQDAWDAAALTNGAYAGLDVSREMEHVRRHSLGATVLLRGTGGALEALAVCHTGAGSEAGSGVCYVKFGAARSGGAFGRLLEAVECYAGARGASTMRAGVNSGRAGAYRRMLDAGYRATQHGVAMERGAGRSYNRPGIHILDDWQ